MSSISYNFKHFNVTFPHQYVAHVELSRPEKYNSINPDMWHGFPKIFDALSMDENVRCVVLSGAGDKAFCSGLDVEAASSSGPVSHPDPKADVARRAWALRRLIYEYQNAVTSIERCEKRMTTLQSAFKGASDRTDIFAAVIVLIHGVTFGAALDIATAGDIRYSTADARMCVKEVDIGLAADVGTLSRLPKVGVNYSWAKEMVYTAKIFNGEEAQRAGLVSEVFQTKADMVKAGLDLAKLIATKSPVAVQSSKALMDFSRDRPIDDGLKYTASWNAAMVQAEDVQKATLSGLRKTKPTFEKL